MSSADGVWPPDGPVKEMMMETLEDSIPGPGYSPGVVELPREYQGSC